MFEAKFSAGPLRALAMCLVIAVCGCGGDDPVSQTEGPGEFVDVSSTAVTSPVSSPVELEPSPDELAAREAFQMMTSEGTSPKEFDEATQQIQELESAALPVLTDALNSEESIEREMAATMLALLGAAASDVSDELVEALDDESDFVRAHAATALAQMEGQAPHVIPVFGEFLESDDRNLQMMAATNLVFLDPAAAKSLVGQLTKTLDSDDPAILRPVVELLGKIGPEAKSAVEKIKSLDTTSDAPLEMAINVAIMQIEADSE